MTIDTFKSPAFERHTTEQPKPEEDFFAQLLQPVNVKIDFLKAPAPVKVDKKKLLLDDIFNKLKSPKGSPKTESVKNNGWDESPKGSPKTEYVKNNGWDADEPMLMEGGWGDDDEQLLSEPA